MNITFSSFCYHLITRILFIYSWSWRKLNDLLIMEGKHKSCLFKLICRATNQQRMLRSHGIKNPWKQTTSITELRKYFRKKSGRTSSVNKTGEMLVMWEAGIQRHHGIKVHRWKAACTSHVWILAALCEFSGEICSLYNSTSSALSTHKMKP